MWSHLSRITAVVLAAFVSSGAGNGLSSERRDTAPVVTVVRGRCVGCAAPFHLDRLQFVASGSAWGSASYLPTYGEGSGVSTMVRTSDGGRHWRPLRFVHQRSAEQEPAFFFLDAQHGWIAWFDAWTAQGHLSVTADGGRTWTHHPAPAISELRFFDALHGWAIAMDTAGASCRTTADGGVRWREARLDISHADAAAFASSLAGAVAGTNRSGDATAVRFTRDGGQHWLPAQLPAETEHSRPATLEWLDTRTAFLVLDRANGQSSLLLRTEDGGETWSRLRIAALERVGGHISALTITTSRRVVLFFELGTTAQMATSVDRGTTWKVVHFPSRVSSCQALNRRLVCTSGMSLLQLREP